MPTKPSRKERWDWATEWLRYLNSLFKSDGSLKRGERIRRVSAIVGENIGTTLGTWNDPLGYWGFTDAGSKLLVPLVVDQGERLKKVRATLLVPTGGSDVVNLNVNRFDSDQFLQDTIATVGSDSMIDAQQIEIAVSEAANLGNLHYTASFDNLTYQNGGFIFSIAHITDVP